MKRIIIIASLLLCSLVTKVYAQADSTIIQKITLKDDSELLGKIIEKNDSVVVFQTLTGLTNNINISLIREIEVARGKYTEKGFIRFDPNRTRLFFGPTARSLTAGSGYFSTYELFIPFLAVGVTDYFILSGGMSLFPGVEKQMFYLAPKLRFISTELFALSGGVFYISAFDSDLGIVYGVTTLGSEMHAITVGLGWGFKNGEMSEDPTIMLGLEIQASNSIKLISENWIFPGEKEGLITFGLRFFGDHLAADFGLMTSTDAQGSFPFMPWVGFAYNF